jgi:hypothetical protein
MDDLTLAKKEIKEIFQGKRVKKLSLQEARKALREADPNIDISDFLKELNEGNYKKALEKLAIEIIATPNAAEYFLPLLAKLI